MDETLQDWVDTLNREEEIFLWKMVSEELKEKAEGVRRTRKRKSTSLDAERPADFLAGF